jgi:hypothetical protein
MLVKILLLHVRANIGFTIDAIDADEIESQWTPTQDYFTNTFIAAEDRTRFTRNRHESHDLLG